MAKSFEVSRVFKGILIALILSFLFTVLLGIIYSLTAMPESSYYPLVTAGLSVFVASFLIAYRCGSKGLIYGLTIGFGFFVCSVILYYIFYDGNPSVFIMLGKLASSLLTGIVGGTLGAILKKS